MYLVHIMSQIRITKTTELDTVLNFLKSKWPLMDEVEIVKMAISRFYQEQKVDFSDLPVEYLDEEQSVGIGISKKQIQNKQTKKYNSEDFLESVIE
jgi:hypothetical protein